MKKKTTIVFLLVLFTVIIGTFNLLISPNPASAADPIELKTSISIPGSNFQNDAPRSMTTSSTVYIGEYVAAFYNYALAIVGIVAVIVLMIAGIIWLTSGGNPGKVGQAKDLIGGSITGLALLLCSWILLNTINPDLLKFKIQNVTQIKEKNLNIDSAVSCEDAVASSTCNAIAMCAWKDNKCMNKIEAGLAKCSVKKAEVPGQQICCCQQSPADYSYVYCKWATYMGSSMGSGNTGAPHGGDCIACGTQYVKVPENSAYKCAEAETAAAQPEPPETIVSAAEACAQLADESSCAFDEFANVNGEQILFRNIAGYCLNKTCQRCKLFGSECGSANWENYQCCNSDNNLTCKCGSESHGDCKLKLNGPNICQ
ncbi:MAG: pilin [Patescibacteria group bacterium]